MVNLTLVEEKSKKYHFSINCFRDIISSFLFMFRRLCFFMNWGPFINYCWRDVYREFFPWIRGLRGLYGFWAWVVWWWLVLRRRLQELRGPRWPAMWDCRRNLIKLNRIKCQEKTCSSHLDRSWDRCIHYFRPWEFALMWIVWLVIGIRKFLNKYYRNQVDNNE